MAYTKEYKEKNREQINLKQHIRKMKREYGVSIEQYNALFTKQDGNCAICGKNQSVIERRLCVDHRHSDGKIRGLLCGKCNTALGLVDDSIDLLEDAIKYLRKVGHSTG